LRELARAIVGLTGNAASTLARRSDVALIYGPLEEVCPLGLAPSASTTAMLALGDALAFVLSRQRDFSHEDFARYHPAGSLGRKLLKVSSVMRQGSDLRIAPDTETVREVFACARRQGRRSGAVMLQDSAGRLSGLFTDSDLAKLIESRRDDALDRPIREVMTSSPRTLPAEARVGAALELLQRYKISEIPIVDGDGRAVGLLDITDVIGIGQVANVSEMGEKGDPLSPTVKRTA
jgi:arabinose-5-phosphate isomerase